MKNTVIIVLFISVITILLSSCMLTGPGYVSGSHNMSQSQEQPRGFYDPVCGNYIENVQNELSWQYQGKIYYFHSSDCMNEFKKTPEKYINQNNNVSESRNNNVLLWTMGGLSMVAMMIFMVPHYF